MVVFDAEEGFEIDGRLLGSMCSRASALKGHLMWSVLGAHLE